MIYEKKKYPMNENIRKLAEQSGICLTDLGGTFNVKDFSIFTKDSNLEKFAELIVKECIKELEASIQGDPYTGETYDNDEVNAIISNNIEAIKEHFGIE
jgi:hypothetical protein